MDICENIRFVKDEIAAAAARASRAPTSIELLAVSKTWPAEAIRKAMEAPPARLRRK